MTIKELSIICKVHYNTMRKWLRDNKVEKADESVNAQYMITDEVIKKAKKHFLTDENNDKESDNTADILIHQIKQKDLQIMKQQDQIDHLQRLLENQQVLTLKAQDKIDLLENTNQIEEKKKWKFWK